MPYKYATFQTNEVQYLTSCVKTGSYGESDPAFRAPRFDVLGKLREIGPGDRIFIHLKGRLYCGPFFITVPHPEFNIQESVGSWYKVNVEQTPPDARPIWLFDKPWCFFFDRDLSMQVNYCFAGLLSKAGFKLPPLGLLDNEVGERLWQVIDENGSPFSDFLQRQTSFAYNGFPKSVSIPFHQALSTRHLVGQSKTPVQYRTRNGIFVRSKSEVLIANFLHDRRISFEYERPLVLGNTFLRPDFYLPDCQVYIEHLGLYDSNPEYRQDWKWKKSLFDTHKVKVVTLFEAEIPQLDSVLLRKLADFGCK